jgi:3-oxoacyl-(acyl-carrier-protein) synthase
MSMPRIFVTGLGVTTALGLDTDTFWNGLLSGTDVVRKIDEWPARSFRSMRSTMVRVDQLRSRLPSHCADAPDVAVCGAIALEQALRSAELRDANERDEVGLIVGTTSGGEMDALAQSLVLDTDCGAGVVERACVGSSTDYLAERFGIGGARATLSSACTSSAAAIVHAAMLIREEVADLVIAGGCDRVRQADYAGFNSLRAISSDYCRPFDHQRGGLIMGDGAAFLVFESERSMRRRHSRPLAEFVGFGMSSDARHATAPHPRGVTLAMKGALEMAAIEPSAIGYVNCHGTGTTLNDKSEAEALADVFSDILPSLYATSTKSLTGHLLGTAGAVEAAICVRVLETGWIPPMKTVRQLDPCVGFRVAIDEPVKVDPKYVMSNSLGFGGTNVSLILGISDL